MRVFAGQPFWPVDCHQLKSKLDFILIQYLLNMTLDAIPTKTGARVISVDTAATGGLRLLEMGIVPGARVVVLNRAPLGDPIRIGVGNYHLALRRQEARSIQVALVTE